MSSCVCLNCKEHFQEYDCNVCDIEITDRCRECHIEVIHGKIPTCKSIKLTGGRNGYGIEDAQYFPSM